MSGKNAIVCASCGARTHGNFCHHCGNALGGRHCTHCGAEFTGPGKFCSECGSASTESRRDRRAAARASSKNHVTEGSGPDVSWWVAGGSMLVLVLVMVWAVGNRDTGDAAGAAGTPPPVPAAVLGQMTPRQTADDLFNRAMTAADNGDTVTRDQFVPMALTAYEAAAPLDMDGIFHVALLHGAVSDYAASLASAQEILAAEPNHILGLIVAAKAAAGLGRTDDARGYYQGVVDHHDTEIARPLPEYQTHTQYFAVARNEALAWLAEN